MYTIEIDNDVFAHLQRGARPFIDTPNSTLRRLLKIDTEPGNKDIHAAPVSKGHQTVDPFIDSLLAASRSKAAKADLIALVRAKVLKPGEPLYLIDYKGQRVHDLSATVAASRLVYKGKQYSMSALAEKLLKQVGYESDSVRGPAHWVTTAGKSIKDLWLEHQEINRKV